MNSLASEKLRDSAIKEVVFNNVVGHQIVLKIASVCNLKCPYCYWFKDAEVYKLPRIMSKNTEEMFIRRLHDHIIENKIDKIGIVFHGGEPMVYTKKRFSQLADGILKIANNTSCVITLSITTNGTLIDDGWALLFKKYNINTAVSIDGTESVHDASRVDFKGKGSYNKVSKGIDILNKHGINPFLLTVVNEDIDSKDILSDFVNKFGVYYFDVLIPDMNWEDIKSQKIPKIDKFMIDLFDQWYNQYQEKGVVIRFFKEVIRSMLGLQSNLQGVGLGPVRTLVILSDGSIEPHDALRISGKENVSTEVNIYKNKLSDIVNEKNWTETFSSSFNLCRECKECNYYKVCGGGTLEHRFSESNRYNNPSIYCEQLKTIYGHIWNVISKDIYVRNENR